MDLKQIEKNFSKNTFNNEDDIKLHFYSDIVKPLLEELNPHMSGQWHSEDTLLAGGRPDATFQNISFEYKKENYFSTPKGIEEALNGRNQRDHGLYDYILGSAGILETDSEEECTRKLLSGIGIGFDGKQFIFARFVRSTSKKVIDTCKLSLSLSNALPVEFYYEQKDFHFGIKRLALLLKQQEKRALTKRNLLSVINKKNIFVRKNILKIYQELHFNLYDLDGSNRVRTLYAEWNRVFGILYGEDHEATDFTEVSSKIRELYGLDDDFYINSKIYLFAMQTFFNIFLKLLIYSFLSQVIDPTFTTKQVLTKQEIDRLFDGTSDTTNMVVDNFFESHFLEWFTYTGNGFEVDIINDTIAEIDQFDLGTFVLKPEEIQDILQELYMELIPEEMRHLMGEYFSPDWIVEHALDMAGFDGDIQKSLVDPCAGSGSFLTQAIKRVIKKNKKNLTYEDIKKITNNIIAFDINPISVIAAKTNYIMTVFSASFDNDFKPSNAPVHIPVFIADSILAPIVYTEESRKTLRLKTIAGELELPKFESFDKGNMFLTKLSNAIHERSVFEPFKNYALSKKLIKEQDLPVVEKLFDTLYILHRSGKDSFWPIILKNSYAPVMIRNKFDYVVGNPPWIAWKSMSKSYRAGSLEIWKSYGIFEKSAYDKKTTHDDFGMAVTYVAMDQYLKEGGTMVFLLPTSFLKSTKGGEGFRKLKIIRKTQNISFTIESVHDFSNVNLFTIPTSAIKFKKGMEMSYPMTDYIVYTQQGRRSQISTHLDWSRVDALLSSEKLVAMPVDFNNKQSAWLTLKDMDFATKLLDTSLPPVYQGRKGIEPAGAKGVYILKCPQKVRKGYFKIENDMSRQRRADIKEKGVHRGVVEETFVYPMLGGRNIEKWNIKSCEFMLVPHSKTHPYGIPENLLARIAPDTYDWLYYYYAELLASRIQNGKFFNKDHDPFYRLDNVGSYTYAPYKVLWKEQTGHMSAVVVSTYLKTIPNASPELFTEDKPIVVDSKVLLLALECEQEAYFVCGIINAPSITEVIDGYAISTNRGIDVLKYIAIPKFDSTNLHHLKIAQLSEQIHILARNAAPYTREEQTLDTVVRLLFLSNTNN